MRAYHQYCDLDRLVLHATVFLLNCVSPKIYNIVIVFTLSLKKGP